MSALLLFREHTCGSALEALCDYALYKSTFTLHYITPVADSRYNVVCPWRPIGMNVL